MIFYKAIKYSILDYCIEKIFNQLSRNLILSKNLHEVGHSLDIADLFEGLTVSKIVVQSSTLAAYNNCTIYSIVNLFEEEYWKIVFSYESINKIKEMKTVVVRWHNIWITS